MNKKHLQPAPTRAAFDDVARLPKLCGADIELGNFITGLDVPRKSGAEASRLLLREISGLPVSASRWGGYDYNSQDWGRKYLKENGGCAYIDLDHLELALPEVLSAYDHVACWHAMLKIAGDAMDSVNAKLPEGQKIVVIANNSDGQDNSYGSHLDFLITRRAWDNIFERRIQYLLYLAAFQASAIVFTGQGKVGAENEMPGVDYQISQRADFLETLVSIETTRNRPIVNSRDEPLCGGFHAGNKVGLPALRMARLHVIFFDNTLCHVASLLKVGVMQIILAMIEAERMNPNLILDHPLSAVWCWSHDTGLKTRAKLITGKRLTAVELQLAFLEEAIAFVEQGGCEGIVPEAEKIVALWTDTLAKLKAGDMAALAPRLDWVLKASIIQQAMEQYPSLTWDSPETKRLDLMYGSLGDGLYWNFERSGFVERVASVGQVERFVHEPPENTRAWTRAMLLRRAVPTEVERVDWDRITFRRSSWRGWSTERTVHLANPLAFGRTETEAVFENSRTLDETLQRLDADQPESGDERHAGTGFSPHSSILDSPSASLTTSAAHLDGIEAETDTQNNPTNETGENQS